MAFRSLHAILSLLYSLSYRRFHVAALSIVIVTVSVFTFDLNNTIIIGNNNNKGIAYAHIFSDTENAVTKNVDGRYQVSFLPYPAGLKVNDTSTRLNFSIMKNNTDASNLFTSLVITDKNTGDIVEQTPYKFHEVGDVTYPYTFRRNGEYNVGIQAKLNGDPEYESSPLMASFDVSVQDMEKMINSLQQIMLFYLTPALAAIVGSIIYIQHKRQGKRTNKH
ncbi:MAG: hypothetical protein M3297_14910 [Thermoproteota archaeon]|nr:hypothetical protein [Thermoproteota archaeon]